MNENESKKYNKEILTTKIQFRIVLMWILSGVLLLCCFANNNKCLNDTLLGGILSIFITAIYSLVDLYINLFEIIDKERTQFISTIAEVLDGYNKYLRDEFQRMINDQNIMIDENNIDMWLKELIHKEACNLNVYTYIERLWKFIYDESKNIFLAYSLTGEYKEIDKYIVEKFKWFESHKLLFQKNEVKTDIIQDELLQTKIDDIGYVIEKARKIIKEQKVDEVKLNDFIDNNRGAIFRLSKLCICNKIDIKLNQLFTMDMVAHKKYTDELFFIPLIPITAMLMIGVLIFIICK